MGAQIAKMHKIKFKTMTEAPYICAVVIGMTPCGPFSIHYKKKSYLRNIISDYFICSEPQNMNRICIFVGFK